ncbi:DUF6544 family protein [Paenibacillus tepidiphilus]|uniref:DUF6544 family protein n=1 Tax=Paenibacillus tepidiphilus TaxID=2608683 RepID=UPI00123B9918|nr:DUF6544 family protein [Paenibacillus tepidiphilus]
MAYVWLGLSAIVLTVILFFRLPYSGTQAEFRRITAARLADTPLPVDSFSADDWKHLPLPVRKYLDTSGFAGTPRMSSMRATFGHVKFVLSSGKPAVSIGYTQANFVQPVARFAFIDTSLYGIPFQGLDSYEDGRGGMKGVLAKAFTLFNQRGPEMDQACLATYLAEALLLPSAALQDNIAWTPIDDTHAQAIITAYGISAGGIFTFRDNGECISFTTNDRTATGMDGSMQQVRWSALMDDYRSVNGIRQPNRLQAVWHYETGDLVYFDSSQIQIEYR